MFNKALTKGAIKLSASKDKIKKIISKIQLSTIVSKNTIY